MVGADVRATLLTPRAPGGVAVIALSGEDRVAAAIRLLGDGAAIDERPRLRWLQVDGERLDQAVVIARPDAATIELHVHGSEAVLRALERALGPLPAAPAGPGERLLRAAASLAQLDLALEQRRLLAPFGGSFAHWVASHAGAQAELHAAQARALAAAALVTPCPVALCGRKNAGKSTLMNRLLFCERVLTGPTPGLTRDPVREAATLDGYPYELIDTAGEGEAADRLDARAMQHGRSARAGAVVVLVVDAAVGVGAVERSLLASATLVVRSKTDTPMAPWPSDVPQPALDLSCVDPAGAAVVRQQVGALLRRTRRLPPAGPAGGVVPLDASELAMLRAALGA